MGCMPGVRADLVLLVYFFFFFQAEDGIRDRNVTGVQTCALPIFDLELDAGVPGEALADLGQLLVRGGGEVVPAEVGDLPLLAAGRRNPRGENAGEASSGCRQEAAAADRLHGSSLSSDEGPHDTKR